MQGKINEDSLHTKPKIIDFLNLADYSIYTDSQVSMEEPLFECIPSII